MCIYWIVLCVYPCGLLCLLCGCCNTSHFIPLQGLIKRYLIYTSASNRGGGGGVSPHAFHDDDLGAELLVDGEDVDESEGEDHEVEGQHRPARLVGL